MSHCFDITLLWSVYEKMCAMSRFVVTLNRLSLGLNQLSGVQ